MNIEAADAAGVHVPANLRRRAAARVIDVCVMFVYAAVATAAGALAVGLIVLSMDGNILLGSTNPGADSAATLLMFVAMCLVPVAVVARYEAVRTARTGQTLGKKIMGIAVVRMGSRSTREVVLGLNRERHLARWALPHLSGLIAALIGAAASYPVLGVYGLLVGVCTGMAGWMFVYASTIWSKDGRGWHDKIARTVVVDASVLTDGNASGDQQPRGQGEPTSPHRKPI